MTNATLSLDFINTEGVERNSPPDRLESLELFLEWAVAKGVVDRSDAARLDGSVSGEAGSAAFLRSARELREALYRIFSASIGGRAPAPADRSILDRQLADALPGLRLEYRTDGFAWELPGAPERLAELLRPIALSAADLLRSDRLDRLKECGGETCSWMFIDESRNRSRRWCDMADCGNRAKARRFYRRHTRAG